MKTWKTKGGQELKICDMSSEHIKNCIKMLERNLDIVTPNHFDSYDDESPMFIYILWLNRTISKINSFKQELAKRKEIKKF